MRACAGLLLTMLWACDEPLSEAQRVESTRVIGARVESAADPERAWPAPGESASLSWLVADPRPAPPLGWAFSLCVGAPTTRGVPECLAPPFAEFRSVGVVAGEPSFSFVMPDADRVIAQGVVCADAEPMLAEPLEASECAGDTTLALIEIGSFRDGVANHNPSIRDELITLGDAPWPEPSAGELALSTCSAGAKLPGLPELRADGAEHEVRVALSDDDREPVERLSGPDLEDLFVSHLSNLGRFERPISVIDAEAPPSVAVRLRAPGSVQGGGEVARAWFVVRDLRGGVDWTLRAVCFVP